MIDRCQFIQQNYDDCANGVAGGAPARRRLPLDKFKVDDCPPERRLLPSWHAVELQLDPLFQEGVGGSGSLPRGSAAHQRPRSGRSGYGRGIRVYELAPLWCLVVRAQLDLHAELARAARDAVGAWRFIRLFAAGYASPIVDGDGWDDGDIREAEKRLGFSLPASLRMAYGWMGRRRDLTCAQDRLLAPHQLRTDETGRVLVFRWECQHVVEWGVPLSAAAEPDPPVVFRYSSELKWHPFLERFSLACVEMVLSEWIIYGAPYATNLELDDATIALMQQQLRRLPLPDYPLRPEVGPVRWFERSGVILREDLDTWLWAGATSPGSIAAVRGALPGDWSRDED
jgi:hypothetical protein